MGLNSLTFGNVNSTDYGVYILSDSVFNAPQRVYNMIDIPGRNGQLAIDEGRYENISVTYPAYVEGSNFTEFSNKVAEVRNAFMAQTGYQRLSDTYHPDEYRLGIYHDDFDIDVKKYLRTGEFDLTFDCKPQRFLTSGETAITFPDGGESSPNLLVYPYYNTTKTTNGITFTDNGDGTVTANGTNTGNGSVEFVCIANADNLMLPLNDYLLSGCTGGSSSKYFLRVDCSGTTPTNINNYNGATAVKVIDDTKPLRISIKVMAGATVNNVTFKPMICLESEYTGKWYPYWDGTRQIYNPTAFEAKPLLKVTGYGTLGVGDRSVIITGTAGQVIYIDCEIMEAWSMSGSAIIPRNDYVQYVGNKFPVLASGVNGISMSGNITRVEVVPRWWRL